MSISDTNAESEELYFGGLRALGAEKRLANTLGFFDFSRKMIYAGLKLRHPQADDAELRRLFCLETLGSELSRKFLGS